MGVKVTALRPAYIGGKLNLEKSAKTGDSPVICVFSGKTLPFYRNCGGMQRSISALLIVFYVEIRRG